MEHRTYLPLVGFALVVASIFSWTYLTCLKINLKRFLYFSVQSVMLLILVLFSLSRRGKYNNTEKISTNIVQIEVKNKQVSIKKVIHR